MSSRRLALPPELVALLGALRASVVILTSVFCLLSASAPASTLYIDGSWGDNSFDGTTNKWVLGTSQGPLQNISAGISAARSGDVLVVAAGFYQETNWNPQAKSLALIPQGKVTIYDSDPWTTDSDGDGIPDAWEVAYGLNAFSTNDAGQASTLPWAQGLSNLQVYQLGIDPRLRTAPLPTITATVSPPPNSAGWNNTNVVVTFTATNAVYSWPPSVTLSTDTNAAEVVCTAVNVAGQVATESVFVSIDQTPPTVALDPANQGVIDQSYPFLFIDYADAAAAVSNQWSAFGSGLDFESLQIQLNGYDVWESFLFFEWGAVGLVPYLPAGTTNQWLVAIADYAGNATTNTVVFTVTGNTPADSDGDGLPDDWETANGLDATAPTDAAQGSALPWAQVLTNWQVYQLGVDARRTNAPLPGVTIHYSMPPNAAGWWNTNVTVWATTTNAVYVTPTGSFAFTTETKDTELAFTAVNAAGEAKTEWAFINLDITPPEITGSPADGDVEHNDLAPIVIQYGGDLSGIATNGLQVILDDVDISTNFQRFADGAIYIPTTSASLTAHTLSITAVDVAGNSITAEATYTNAAPNGSPSMSDLNLASGVTILPDVPQLWLQGKRREDTITVSASVNFGPEIPLNARGLDFGYLLPLEPGTNVLVVTASNHTTEQRLVVRGDSFQGTISSPGFGAYAQGQPVPVSGTISAVVDAGLPSERAVTGVTINEIACELTGPNGSGLLTFTTPAGQPVPTSTNGGITVITGTVTTSNGAPVSLPTWYVEGYRILDYRWATEWAQAGFQLTCTADPALPAVVYTGIHQPLHGRWVEDWTALGGTQHVWGVKLTQDDHWTNTNWACLPGADVDHLTNHWAHNGTSSSVTTNYPSGPLGLVQEYGDEKWTQLIPYAVHESWYNRWAGHFTFVAPLWYATDQVVLLTFTGVTLKTNNWPVSLAELTYKGEPPNSWDDEAGSVSYWVSMPGGATNRIEASCFNWPKATAPGNVGANPPTTLLQNFLRFTEFHNQKAYEIEWQIIKDCDIVGGKELCKWGAADDRSQVKGSYSTTAKSVTTSVTVKDANACNSLIEFDPPNGGAILAYLKGVPQGKTYDVNITANLTVSGRGPHWAALGNLYGPDAHTRLVVPALQATSPTLHNPGVPNSTTNTTVTVSVSVGASGKALIALWNPTVATNADGNRSAASCTITINSVTPQ